MHAEGPPLIQLTNRLARCPAEFLAEPGGPAGVEPAAVLWDLLDLLGEPHASASDGVLDVGYRNHQRVQLVAAWLLADAWPRAVPRAGKLARAFFETGLKDLAAVTLAPLFVDDPDRREELARLALAAFDLRPEGESETTARDRLEVVSGVARARLREQMKAADARAQAVRVALARKAAEEAASKEVRE